MKGPGHGRDIDISQMAVPGPVVSGQGIEAAIPAADQTE